MGKEEVDSKHDNLRGHKRRLLSKTPLSTSALGGRRARRRSTHWASVSGRDLFAGSPAGLSWLESTASTRIRLDSRFPTLLWTALDGESTRRVLQDFPEYLTRRGKQQRGSAPSPSREIARAKVPSPIKIQRRCGSPRPRIACKPRAPSSTVAYPGVVRQTRVVRMLQPESRARAAKVVRHPSTPVSPAWARVQAAIVFVFAIAFEHRVSVSVDMNSRELVLWLRRRSRSGFEIGTSTSAVASRGRLLFRVNVGARE